MALHVIRVGIVDDHAIVREGTAALLMGVPDMTVVGTAGTVAGSSALLGDDVDVLLLDIRLGEESGLHILRDRGERGGPAVVLFTSFDYPQYVEAAMRLGASGFILKTAPLGELLEVIRRVASGGLAFSVRPRSDGRAHLSGRELQVVRLVVDGLSNDEVATRLAISTRTVEAHLHRIFARLGLVSRTELASRAIREGWLDAGD